MVRLNTLQRKVLISTDEVIFHAPTQATLDPRTILNSIIVAEERFIRPALTTDLYDLMVTQKNVLITNGNLSAMQAKINTSMAGITPIPTLKEGDLVHDVTGLSAANLELWREYLWKLTAECVIFCAYPEGFVHFGSQGLVHNNPTGNLMMTTNSNLTTPELKSVRFMMDKKLQDRIDPLIEAMHTWICKRSHLYPLYNKECDCDANGVAYKRKSDFVMGLYDEDEGGCGCD